MKRADLIIVQQKGTLASKARPCVVIQSNLALPAGIFVTICPLTSVLRDYPLVRVRVTPTPRNGLLKISDVEVDLVQSVETIRVRETIGTLDGGTMTQVDTALRRWLDL